LIGFSNGANDPIVVDKSGFPVTIGVPVEPHAMPSSLMPIAHTFPITIGPTMPLWAVLYLVVLFIKSNWRDTGFTSVGQLGFCCA